MNSNQPNLITFCCLGYNHAKFLKENLDSISRINYDNIEVVVVDDGSKDNSVELLEKIKADYPYPIQVIAQSNTGNIGGNFNNAIKKAKGQLISFIALDDVYNPAVMLSEINQMNENPTLGFIASTQAVFIDDQGMVDKNRLQQLTQQQDNFTLEELLEYEYNKFGAFYLQGSIIRKDIIDAVGGFDEDMTGDDIVLRTKIFNYLQQHPEITFKIIQQSNVFYRQHDNNVHKNLPRQIKIVTQYLERYWPDKPNPQELINWINFAIHNKGFEESMPIFALNKRAASLLNEKAVQQQLKETLLNSNPSFFKRFIYNKQKQEGKKQVTLLGVIKFTYQRSKNKQNKKNNKEQQEKIHYTQYH